jgi:hypothetical protein
VWADLAAVGPGHVALADQAGGCEGEHEVVAADRRAAGMAGEPRRPV